VLIGLVRDILTNEPLGIHRTALTADGRKLDRPKLLGPTLGRAIKLSGEYVASELTIAEGIETALSATMLVAFTGSSYFAALRRIRQLETRECVRAHILPC
jgi:hypothetical protein